MIRERKFSIVSKTRIAQSISGASIQVGLGLLGVAPVGLLMGQIFQSGAGALRLAVSFFRCRSLRNVKLSGLKNTFKQYERFPKFSTWEALANSGSIHLPIIIIGASVAGAEAGFLMLAMRLLSAPLGLIGGAVGQVYLVEAAGKLHEGELRRFTLRTVYSLIKIGTLPLVIAGLAAPLLVSLVFGEEWVAGGG